MGITVPMGTRFPHFPPPRPRFGTLVPWFPWYLGTLAGKKIETVTWCFGGFDVKFWRIRNSKAPLEGL